MNAPILGCPAFPSATEQSDSMWVEDVSLDAARDMAKTECGLASWSIVSLATVRGYTIMLETVSILLSRQRAQIATHMLNMIPDQKRLIREAADKYILQPMRETISGLVKSEQNAKCVYITREFVEIAVWHMVKTVFPQFMQNNRMPTRMYGHGSLKTALINMEGVAGNVMEIHQEPDVYRHVFSDLRVIDVFLRTIPHSILMGVIVRYEHLLDQPSYSELLRMAYNWGRFNRKLEVIISDEMLQVKTKEYVRALFMETWTAYAVKGKLSELCTFVKDAIEFCLENMFPETVEAGDKFRSEWETKVIPILYLFPISDVRVVVEAAVDEWVKQLVNDREMFEASVARIIKFVSETPGRNQSTTSHRELIQKAIVGIWCRYNGNIDGELVRAIAFETREWLIKDAVMDMFPKKLDSKLGPLTQSPVEAIANKSSKRVLEEASTAIRACRVVRNLLLPATFKNVVASTTSPNMGLAKREQGFKYTLRVTGAFTRPLTPSILLNGKPVDLFPIFEADNLFVVEIKPLPSMYNCMFSVRDANGQTATMLLYLGSISNNNTKLDHVIHGNALILPRFSQYRKMVGVVDKIKNLFWSDCIEQFAARVNLDESRVNNIANRIAGIIDHPFDATGEDTRKEMLITEFVRMSRLTRAGSVDQISGACPEDLQLYPVPKWIGKHPYEWATVIALSNLITKSDPVNAVFSGFIIDYINGMIEYIRGRTTVIPYPGNSAKVHEFMCMLSPNVFDNAMKTETGRMFSARVKELRAPASKVKADQLRCTWLFGWQVEPSPELFWTEYVADKVYQPAPVIPSKVSTWLAHVQQVDAFNAMSDSEEKRKLFVYIQELSDPF